MSRFYGNIFNVPMARQWRSSAAPAAPTITSATSGIADVGVAFSHTFTATGNPAPTLSYQNEDLPDGITRTGDTLSGTPTESGSFSIDVIADNDVDPNGTQTFALEVSAEQTYETITFTINGVSKTTARHDWYEYEIPNAATKFHVATTGNDSNDGSEGSPWLTFAKAMQTAEDDEYVIIHEGTYEATNSHTTSKSGSSGHRIAYVGAWCARDEDGDLLYPSETEMPVIQRSTAGILSNAALNTIWINGESFLDFVGLHVIGTRGVSCSTASGIEKNSGIYLQGVGATDNRIINCWVEKGCHTGINTGGAGHRLEVRNSIITDNGVNFNDHGVYISGDDIVFDKCVIWGTGDGSGTDGAAFHGYVDPDNLTVTNCLIGGGKFWGVVMGGHNSTFDHCTIVDNAQRGFDWYSDLCDNVTLSNSIIINNSPNFHEDQPNGLSFENFSTNNMLNTSPGTIQYLTQTNTLVDDPELTNTYLLSENSPAIGAGAAGSDLGAFPYLPTEEPLPYELTFQQTFATGTPEVGTYTVTDTGTVWSVSSGKFAAGAANTSFNVPRLQIDGAIADPAGVAAVFEAAVINAFGTTSEVTFKAGWFTSITGDINQGSGFFFNQSSGAGNFRPLGNSGNTGGVLATQSINTTAKYCIMLTDVGYDMYVHYGSAWEHVWHSIFKTAGSLLFGISNPDGTSCPVEIYNLERREYDGAAYTDDYGLAAYSDATPTTGDIITGLNTDVNVICQYALNGSPAADEVAIQMDYRRVDASNYYFMRVKRNAGNTAWTIEMGKVVATSETIQTTSATGGNSSTGLMALCDGTAHTGIRFTSSSHDDTNTATNDAALNAGSTAKITVHASTTCSMFAAYNRNSSSYNVFD